MKFAVHLLIYAIVLAFVACFNFDYGNSTGYILISRGNVSLRAYPGFVIKKGYWYNDSLNRQIKAIHCVDNLNSEAIAYHNNLPGGIDYSFVKLYFLSEIDRALDYDCEIYSNNKTVD